MDGPLADRKRSLLDRLRASRMRMAGAGEIFRAAAKLHEIGRFVDHFPGFAADDVHAEHAIRFRICENLHITIRGLNDLGTAISAKRKLSDGVSLARLLQLL